MVLYAADPTEGAAAADDAAAAVPPQRDDGSSGLHAEPPPAAEGSIAEPGAAGAVSGGQEAAARAPAEGASGADAAGVPDAAVAEPEDARQEPQHASPHEQLGAAQQGAAALQEGLQDSGNTAAVQPAAGEADSAAAAAAAAADAADAAADAADAAADADADADAAAAAAAAAAADADADAAAAAAGADAGADAGPCSQQCEPTSAADTVTAAGNSAAGSHTVASGSEAAAGTAHAADAAKASQLDTNTRQPDRSYFVDGMRAIDVEVDCGEGLPCKLLHVAIDVSALQASSKPYLGGLRHTQAGTTFHHASMQTQAEGQAGSGGAGAGHPTTAAAGSAAAGSSSGGSGGRKRIPKLSRETQTLKEASRSCQSLREAATQAAVPGLLLDCSGDRVLTPRAYVPGAVVEQRRAAATLTIQRFTRGWFARQRAANLRAIKAERDAFLSATAAEAAGAAQEHRRREVLRRTHPLCKGDFELLQAELEGWRQQQAAAIKAASLPRHEEQAALQLMLAKETRLLQALDRLRVNAHHEHRAHATQQQLGRLAAPTTWSLSNGKQVLVHTPSTVRAAELQQLYRGLMLGSLSLDERLDVLLHVKWVAKECDCALTRELVALIDREADLLNRGRSPATMDGLRRRIAGLFLTFCQTPDFNPAAARLHVNAVGANGPESFEYVLA